MANLRRKYGGLSKVKRRLYEWLIVPYCAASKIERSYSPRKQEASVSADPRNLPTRSRRWNFQKSTTKPTLVDNFLLFLFKKFGGATATRRFPDETIGSARQKFAQDFFARSLALVKRFSIRNNVVHRSNTYYNTACYASLLHQKEYFQRKLWLYVPHVYYTVIRWKSPPPL